MYILVLEQHFSLWFKIFKKYACWMLKLKNGDLDLWPRILRLWKIRWTSFLVQATFLKVNPFKRYRLKRKFSENPDKNKVGTNFKLSYQIKNNPPRRTPINSLPICLYMMWICPFSRFFPHKMPFFCSLCTYFIII